MLLSRDRQRASLEEIDPEHIVLISNSRPSSRVFATALDPYRLGKLSERAENARRVLKNEDTVAGMTNAWIMFRTVPAM